MTSEPLDLATVLRVASGEWVGRVPPGSRPVAGFSTDSRTVRADEVFVALSGERFDGHDYVPTAFEAGAVAAIVAAGRVTDLPERCGQRGLIAVDDPLDALERLAVWHRERLDVEVTAITGSVGKTTTKEFLAAILEQRFAVAKAPRSFNNRLGVALTILGAPLTTRHLVLELGTSGPGEISYLSRLVRPDRVVLTTIAPAHLSGLGSLEGVIAAKAEILDGLSPSGRAFLNVDMPGFETVRARATAPVTTFGAGERAADLRISGSELVCGEQGFGLRFRLDDLDLFLPVPGRHNLVNAAAAVAVARDVGLDDDEIRAGLATCRLPPGRLEISRVGGVLLIDDSYNANPRSMEAAFSALDDLQGVESSDGDGRRVVILGDMLELGEGSRALHEELGAALALRPVDVLLTVGELSRHLGEAYERASTDATTLVRHFERPQEAIESLEGLLAPGDRVLFKASNGIGLVGLVRGLCERIRERHEGAVSG